MREDLAQLVHPVLAKGLELRDRLFRGEDPSWQAEQVNLLALLLSEQDALRVPEFGGDDPNSALHRAASIVDAGASGPFLGARYALVCWLDEMFILDTTWQSVWNEHKLEVQLYSGNDRAWRFWEQAKIAAARGHTSALEVYFLCVMLGFSGELLESPAKLGEWAGATRQVLGKFTELSWRPLVGIDPKPDVKPLHGRSSVRRMLLVACAVVLALVPVVAVVLARRME